MPLPSLFRITSASGTHTGRVRKHNEDSFLDRADLGLWAVADGMGGHQDGALASALIVETLAAAPFDADLLTFAGAAERALGEANSRLVAEAASRGAGTVIGSTAVLLIIRGVEFACLWAGDSRLYRMRGGALERITRDHTRVQDLIDAGMLGADEAEGHPQSNVITRAVGAREGIEIDRIRGMIAPQDIYIVCSDGLSRMISDEEIAAIVGGTAFQRLPEALIAAALERGGRDNVSVVAVHIGAAVEEAGDDDDTLPGPTRPGARPI